MSELLRGLRDGVSAESFAAKYGHPWLICRLPSAGEKVIPFRTAMKDAPASQPYVPVEGEFSRELRSNASLFDIVAVVKSAGNPWVGRIIVGRAPNNDIVLRDPSVSKSHAALVASGPRGWHLEARKTINGTKLNGVMLEEGVSSERLATGARIIFGNVQCEFVDSARLFQALSS